MGHSTEERDRILQLVEMGRISAVQAAQLLDAISSDPDRPSTDRPRNRLLRVRVTDLNTNRPKAVVAIPVSLINVGMRLGTRLAPQISGSTLEQLLQSIEHGATGRLLEWQDLEEGERIELFVE